MTLRTLPMLLGLAMVGVGCTGPADDGKETADPEVLVEDCGNTADDDDDGDIDCDDSDCADDAACAIPDAESACTDGLDNDADGELDCADDDCAGDAACQTPDVETLCADGLDDDGDAAIDCADTDCAADAACIPATETLCADGLDDDGDAAIDCADTDCAGDAACGPPPSETNCFDGVDEDADGLTDCDDPDCDGADACIPTTESDCSDRLDEDADGLTDCDDPDCAAACEVVVETDCTDTVDDDVDGAIDCDDSDCRSDAACLAAVCGDDGDLGSAIGYGLATGTTTGGGDDFMGSCSSAAVEDRSYTWTAPSDGTWTVTTVDSDYDTLIQVYDGTCGTEYDCDDDGGGYPYSLISFAALAGEEVVVVIDGYSTTGNFVLSIYAGSDTSCTDGTDEDGDGFTDCDDTDCAADPTCIPEFECEDTLDSDLDGLVDCDDTDCAADLHCTHPCADDDLGSPVGDAVATGTTLGAGDDNAPSCSGAGAEDVAWVWAAPADGVYTFDTTGSAFDTTLTIEMGDCSGTDLGCDDDVTGATAAVSVALVAGEEVIVHVDGSSTPEVGDYTLNIWADSEVDCADGGDEDLDGLADCDDDECATAVNCVPESVCSDGADSDLDGDTDCLDADCAADGVCDTSLADYDLGSATGSSLATGSTVGMGDEFAPTCGSSAAEDVAYAWVAPYAGSWAIDLSGSDYDTVLGIFGADGAERVCDDDGSGTADSLEVVALNAGQLLIIDVDGYSSGSGNYVVSIYPY